VAARSLIPRLTDMIEAIEGSRAILRDIPIDVFEADWQRQWLVERGVEIVSEASHHLTDELKARHPEIPWQKVAGIGNVLRHDYESIAAPVMWKLRKPISRPWRKSAAKNSRRKGNVGHQGIDDRTAAAAMKEQRITKVEIAAWMQTSRAQIDRLLDPKKTAARRSKRSCGRRKLSAAGYALNWREA